MATNTSSNTEQTVAGRGLHYVFKLGDRGANAFFFRDVLGMRVLRHEEFDEGGCDAKCNGPYDNRWSKTMMGYGSEHTHFIMELTYNYGIQSYRCGNEFVAITLRSAEALQRARLHNYPIETDPSDGVAVLRSPDGYRFRIIDAPQPADSHVDPVERLTLATSDLERSLLFWRDTIGMQVRNTEIGNATRKAVVLYYDHFIDVELQQLEAGVQLDRAEAFGRTVFAVPYAQQPYLNDRIRTAPVQATVLHELLSLDTPGKATVRVLVVADPDGHEICFVDDEGFTQLSEPDECSEAEFDKYIAEDPFQV